MPPIRMTLRRTVGNGLAMLALFISTASHSWLTTMLGVVGGAYVVLEFGLTARAGYLRRRLHWTPGTWRRFLAVCSAPAAALAISIAMAAAVEMRLPIAGPSNSPARSVWAGGIIGFMVIGVGGLVAAIEWLARGDPSRQLSWPRWFRRGSA